MQIKFKNMQPGMKQVINEAGDVLSYVIKLDGEIAIDHIKTADDDDATVFPKDNEGKPLKTYKQAMEFLEQWFSEDPYIW